MTAPESAFRMAQDLNVLTPRSDKAYPIPCKEWEHIKSRVEKLTDEPFMFQTIGGALIGVAFSTITSLLTGSVTGADPVRAAITAWAITIGSAIAGVLCLVFAMKERGSRRDKATDIVAQMDLIEERFMPRSV